MTLRWFIVWAIVNTCRSHRPLVFDSVNAWTATLILAIALDLASGHAPTGRRRKSARRARRARRGRPTATATSMARLTYDGPRHRAGSNE